MGAEGIDRLGEEVTLASKRRLASDRSAYRNAVRRMLTVSFLLICFVFMFHNTLYRDRTFLLFLGISTAIARKEGFRAAPEPEVVR